MVERYSGGQARKLMNQWGKENKSFLFVVDYLQEDNVVLLLDDICKDELLYAFPSGRNDGKEKIENTGSFTWKVFPEPLEQYRSKFEAVQRQLHAGNTFLLNLTCRIPLETDLSLKDIYLRSHALYKLWMRGRLVCFSPEIFISINNGIISSYPMKGTLDAALPDAERILLDDEKEAAEHATIVDLIRDDLSHVAENVHVPRYRYIDVLHTHQGDLLQTSSEITGHLPGNYREHIGDILFAQLPAGSITGAPKNRTCEIIAETEGYERGFYTGIMGIYQNGCLDSAVMIRFVESSEGRLYFKAGGGITSYSRCENEYKEVIQKAYVPIY